MAPTQMIMCRSCGTFLEVLEDDGDLVVLKDECPECGGNEFKRNDTGDVVRTGE